MKNYQYNLLFLFNFISHLYFKKTKKIKNNQKFNHLLYLQNELIMEFYYFYINEY